MASDSDKNQERPVLFECAKLFEVQESTPGAGGENPSHSLGEPRSLAHELQRCALVVRLALDSQSSIGIELCAWKECTGHNALVLVCNNGELHSSTRV